MKVHALLKCVINSFCNENHNLKKRFSMGYLCFNSGTMYKGVEKNKTEWHNP